MDKREVKKKKKKSDNQAGWKQEGVWAQESPSLDVSERVRQQAGTIRRFKDKLEIALGHREKPDIAQEPREPES